MIRRVAVVTGATSGIGRATSDSLAGSGIHVVLVVRDPVRGEQERAAIVARGGTAEVVVADLSSHAAVRAAAAEIGQRHAAIHLLINNAGGVVWHRETTVDGLERTFALNVLSPFLLTRLLEPNLLAAGGGSRVVWVSSAAHFRGRIDLADLESRGRYRGFSVYSTSKLALILVCRVFATRAPPAEIAHFAVHPGFVRSRFGQGGGRTSSIGMRIAMIFGISPAKAARTVVYAATSPELANESGTYVSREHRSESSSAAHDAATGARLWEILSGLVNLPP